MASRNDFAAYSALEAGSLPISPRRETCQCGRSHSAPRSAATSSSRPAAEASHLDIAACSSGRRSVVR